MNKEKYDEAAATLNTIPTDLPINDIEQEASSKQANELCWKRYFNAEVSILTRFILSFYIMVIYYHQFK